MLPAIPTTGKKKKRVARAEEPRDSLKNTKDVVACVVDYGSFICLAEGLATHFKKVYYYTPTSKEFYSIDDLVKASGLDKVERVEDLCFIVIGVFGG